MKNLLTATVTIEGTRPLLWNRFGPDSIPLQKVERTGVAGNDPEEWKRGVLMTVDRQLYLQPTQLFGALRDGARYTRKGRATLMTPLVATTQVIDAQVLVNRFVPEEPVPTDPSHPVYIDIRSARNPGSKNRNVRYRVASSPGWQATFSFIWDRTILSRSEMEAILRDAGTLCGLGDGRSIGFGRFAIQSFSVSEQDASTPPAA